MSKDAWNPQQYEKFKKERSRPFFDLLEMVRPGSIASAVDLGCGTGELTADLHARLKSEHTIGIDSSAEMMKKAEAFQIANQLEFQHADLEKWRADIPLNLIFSNAALQWCTNHSELFHKFRDMLAPGGQIAIQMPMNQDYATHVLATAMAQEKPWVDKLGEADFESQWTVLRPEEYAKILFNLGFKDQNVLMKVYGHVLDSREGVVEWVKGTTLNRFKSRLSESDYSEFLIAYRERLFKQLPDEQPFFYSFKRLFVWGSV
jgi:trans-aconitate 2-methyltransferase